MAARAAGVSKLFGRASLEHPRTRTYGRLKFTTFDASVQATYSTDDNYSIPCVLRYICLASDMPIISGTYDIEAKVSV